MYRFDGIHFTHYSGKDTENNLGRESITCIFEDQQHNLWIGARSGLNRYNPQGKDFDKFSIGEETYPRYMHPESDSSFLVHSDKGTYLFYPRSGRWDKLNIEIDDVKSIVAVRGQGDDLWIGSENFIRKFDLRKKTFDDFQLPLPSFAHPEEKISVVNLFMDSHDQLWINTWWMGVVKLDTRSGTMELFDIENQDPDKTRYSLYDDVGAITVEHTSGNGYRSINSPLCSSRLFNHWRNYH